MLGLALGIGEGIARRSVLPAALAVQFGAGGGLLGGLLACLVQEWVRANVGLAEFQHTVATQLALAVPLAAGVGLALGIATLSPSGFIKTLLASLAAGVLAGVLYPLLTSLLFPNISTDSFLPDEAASRLLWLGLLAGLIGLAVPIAGRRRKRSLPASPSPAKASASRVAWSPPRDVPQARQTSRATLLVKNRTEPSHRWP